MKCLIFSDSHGNYDYMRSVIRRHKDAEAIFFLGDGLSDFDEVMWSVSTAVGYPVLGNCDFYKTYKGAPVRKTESISLMNKKIVYTHGDLYGAKYGTQGLLDLAQREGADIILYGHTHNRSEAYVSEGRGVYLFNPGSIGAYPHSYGIMTLTESAVLFSHGECL